MLRKIATRCENQPVTKYYFFVEIEKLSFFQFNFLDCKHNDFKSADRQKGSKRRVFSLSVTTPHEVTQFDHLKIAGKSVVLSLLLCELLLRVVYR
jgi:hypothetical protein